MGFLRTAAVGLGVVGAAAGLGIAGGGAATALAVTPIPGGVQVDLNHADTVWAYQNNVGPAVASIPNASAQSFGAALHDSTWLASQFPQGRVTFTVEGPVTNVGGIMVVFEQ